MSYFNFGFKVVAQEPKYIVDIAIASLLNCTEQSAVLKILKLLQLKACSSLLRVPERPFLTLPQVHRCQESLLKGSANIAGGNWAAE